MHVLRIDSPVRTSGLYLQMLFNNRQGIPDSVLLLSRLVYRLSLPTRVTDLSGPTKQSR
jgi:hypothetical protein